MRKLFRYFTLIKQKPAIVPRGIKGLFLSNVCGRKVLRGAELAVTYRCQAACKKCSTRSLIDEQRQEISFEQIIDIAQQIVDAGGILIDLTGGEPLLRDDIVPIVRRLSTMPILVSLATNGLLLTADLLFNLKKAGLNVIQFGLASPIAHEHDEEIGIEGSFNTVVSRIKEARDLDIEVLINTVITRDILYSERIEQLALLAQENGCFLSIILPAQVGGWQDAHVCLDERDYEEIEKLLKYSFITTDTESCYKRGRCPAGTEKVYISAYGDLYPCPFIQKKVGCLLENDFVPLWKGMVTNGYHKCINIKCRS